MDVPNKYKKYFNFEVGDKVKIKPSKGGDGEVFVIHAKVIESYYSKEGKSQIYQYMLIDKFGEPLFLSDDDIEIADYGKIDGFNEQDIMNIMFPYTEDDFEGENITSNSPKEEEKIDVEITDTELRINGYAIHLDNLTMVRDPKKIAEKKDEIIDDMLDEYNNYKQLYHVLEDEGFKEEMERVQKELKEILS